MFHSFPTPWSTSFVRRADDKPAAHFLHCLCISPEVARRRFSNWSFYMSISHLQVPMKASHSFSYLKRACWRLETGSPVADMSAAGVFFWNTAYWSHINEQISYRSYQ
jgi:hypothetical protein